MTIRFHSRVSGSKILNYEQKPRYNNLLFKPIPSLTFYISLIIFNLNSFIMSCIRPSVIVHFSKSQFAMFSSGVIMII